MKLILSPQAMSQIEEHGARHYPEEAAGLLLGKQVGSDRQITAILPLANTFDEGQRERRYLISPEAMVKAEDDAEALGLEIVGVFHSHPDHPARPSEFDRSWAWPWFAYIITSIQAGKPENHRAWQLSEDRSDFNEIPLLVEHNEEVS